ncbi:MAG: hypothetical protein LAO09_07850 [Acidobacteriia bacterium]|nr:hypothetical protein [Terriglobia bacterium]
MPTLRWAESQPGCTFSADDDGKYRYGLWTEEFGIILAVDSQELRKTALRTEPIFAVLLTVRYRGQDSLSLRPADSSLEFVKHYRDVQPALDPDNLATRFWNDTARFSAQTEQEIRKHPEKKADKEAALQEHKNNVGQMLEFLKARSLREVKVDANHPEAAGWLFFSARSKWVGGWKKQEEFVLRIALPDRTIEFPFALPPSQGDLILRRR